MSLDKCDPEVYKNGVTIAIAWGHGKKQTEKLTQRATKITGVQVDWSYVGGVPVIKALGEIEKAINYLRRYRKYNQRSGKKYRITIYGVREIENQNAYFSALMRGYHENL